MSSQRLTAVHLVDEGVYLVQPAWGAQYEAAGLTAPSGTPFAVKDLTSIVCVTRGPGEILRRTNPQGESIAEADYQAQRAALEAGSTVDNDIGVRHWPSLDAEFAYRRFLERWPTFERAPDVITRELAQVDVIEVRTSSGDPDIVSLWNAPDLHAPDRRCLFSVARVPLMVRTAQDLCAAAGLKLELPGHSGLEFAKIEGDYAFNSSDYFKVTERIPFIGTLEQCKTEKAARVAAVARVVARYDLKKRGTSIPDAGSVLIALAEIRSRVQRLSVSSKDRLSREGAANLITKLMDAISSASSGGPAASTTTPEKT